MYPLKDTVGLIGITSALANNWSLRYPGVKIQHSGRGKGRRQMVSEETVIKLRLMKVLTCVGMPAERALRIADDILSEIDITGRHGYYAVDYHATSSVIPLPSQHQYDAALKINVGGIIRRVRSGLSTIAQPEND